MIQIVASFASMIAWISYWLYVLGLGEPLQYAWGEAVALFAGLFFLAIVFFSAEGNLNKYYGSQSCQTDLTKVEK